VPTCSTTTAGTINMATNYEATDDLFTETKQYINYEWGVSANLWAPHSYVVRPNARNKLRYYIRAGPISTGSDLLEYDIGLFQMMIVGGPVNTNVGRLLVSYAIELMVPELAPSALSDATRVTGFVGSPGFSSAHPFMNSISAGVTGTGFWGPNHNMSPFYDSVGEIWLTTAMILGRGVWEWTYIAYNAIAVPTQQSWDVSSPLINFLSTDVAPGNGAQLSADYVSHMEQPAGIGAAPFMCSVIFVTTGRVFCIPGLSGPAMYTNWHSYVSALPFGYLSTFSKKPIENLPADVKAMYPMLRAKMPDEKLQMLARLRPSLTAPLRLPGGDGKEPSKRVVTLLPPDRDESPEDMGGPSLVIPSSRRSKPIKREGKIGDN